MRNPLTLCCLLFFLSGCFMAEELPPDQDVWEYELPENVGMNQQRLKELDLEIDILEFDNIESLMIIKDGKMVFENYYRDTGRGTLFPQQRLTSVFATVAVGILLRDGLLDSVNTPINELLPEYDYIFDAEPGKRSITVRNLLEYTTGLIWNELNFAYDSPSNFINAMKASEDWVEFVLEQPQEAAPGLRVVYSSGNAILISRIVENLTGSSAEDYIKENIFEPLEIEDYIWAEGSEVSTNLADGLYLSTIDLTKIAYLYLNGGFWEGQELIPNSWIRESSQVSKKVSRTYNFGLGWWVFSEEFNISSRIREDEMFFFTNTRGNHIYVIPELNMTITITASNFFYGFSNPSLFLFLNIIEAS